MFVTIALCTWNRAPLLDQTLTQLRKLRIPAGVEWEVLVVNNNCTDGTDAVIAGHAEHLPVRRLFEATPGLSQARNCAVAAARGELILWTDDDALPREDWIAEYIQAAQRWPLSAFFGGPIEPLFELSPPRWLRSILHELEHVYGLRDFGPRPIPFTNVKLPFGANFCVRTSIQRKYKYDPRVGITPSRSVRGSETTMLKRLVADGLEGMYVRI